MNFKTKTHYWVSMVILVGVGLWLSPHQVLTRTAEVSRALQPVLSSYEVIGFQPDEIERQLRTTGELRFRFNQTDFYFRIEPHDMRTPDYRAVETGLGGATRKLPRETVSTFKGTLSGQEDMRGRFNLTDDGIEGVVFAPEDWYFLEPLRNFVPSATAGELVVYRQSDVRPGQAFRCGVSLSERLRQGANRMATQVEAVSLTNYVFEVATEADYDYVQALGGSEAANREILGILNQVEGIYQSELLLQLRIGFQHTWATQDESYPYTAANTFGLLDEFAGYWNTHYAATEDYDIAHLWTDKERDDSAIAGLAYSSVACSHRNASYGLTARSRDTLALLRKFSVPAHEIGHNFGAIHPDQENPPVAGCSNTLMQSSTDGAGLTFCQFSRDQIADHVSNNHGCLATRPITLQPPTQLVAASASASRIDLTWQDNSSNETGFIVQRRVDGSGHWVELGNTPADATTFSNDGLFPDTTYIYCIRALNNTESSAYSNEAAATTPAGSLSGSVWRIDTIVGGKDNVGDNGPATASRLQEPAGVALDGAGNLYIADSANYRVRRVDPQGTITTVAGTGTWGEYSADGGPAVEAELGFFSDVAVDGAGNLYFAETANNRVRRVDAATGIVTTVAGTGAQGYGGDDGPAVEAWLNRPVGVAVDSAGNLYVGDGDNFRIRRVDVATGIINTVAGNGVRGYSGDGGPAVEAQLFAPLDLAVDSAGNLYIPSGLGRRVRRVDAATGTITTVAGTGERGSSGDGGPATMATFRGTEDVEVDAAGNIYIADRGSGRIRRVDAGTGIITTVAGAGGRAGFSGDGGPAVEAQLFFPQGVAVDAAGNIYIADRFNHRIRRVDTAGTITTFAGTGNDFSGAGGPAILARLNRPHAVIVDDSGNLYIADTWNHQIHRVDASGIVTTVAGTGEFGYSGDGGPAVAARLTRPWDVSLDGEGNLYIADTLNHAIRRVDASGTITTVAGSGEFGYSGDDGPAVEAQLNSPRGVEIDSDGNVYISDSLNHRIRRVDASGTIGTVVGTGEFGYSGDGGPAVAAQLGQAEKLAFDSAGNLYIADTFNSRIRRVDPAGTITTLAGLGESDFSGDGGPAVAAHLNGPSDVFVDDLGNMYIADRGNNRIRLVDSSGNILTIAGPRQDDFFSGGFNRESGPAIGVLLRRPHAISVDRSGNVYVADTGNHRIRVLTQPPQPPSGLTARVVSFSGIDLAWRDNSANETGFRVQRQVDGSTDWVEIKTTLANTTRYSDTGLEPGTTYHYRVRAVNNTGASGFSNQASATTQALLPPTLTGFSPSMGSVGTRVTLTGTLFLGATDVLFNGVRAPEFEVVSGTSIEALVPPGAASGPISLVTPGGKAVSEEHFTVIRTGIQSRLFVPVVLRLQGRTPGSFFTSELTLTNRGSTTAEIRYTYRASFGRGSGTAADSLGPGRQRIVPDAIAYLISLGVPIGEGAAGGTLAVEFSNLSSESAAAVTVRTSTPVEDGRGQAGLAYVGVTPEDLLTGASVIAGLRQNRPDRSNVAVQNAGNPGEGTITLRVAVYSGDREAPGSLVLPDLSLPPGGFHQYNGILTEAGFDNGYVRVERVEGTAPYYAYGVINDNFNSDGSFVFPVAEDSLKGKTEQTLPVIVETRNFTSELAVTNSSESPRTLDLRFVADTVDSGAAGFSLALEAGEQIILPSVVDYLRGQGVAGIGPAGPTFAGALFARVSEGDMSGIVIGARTGSPGGGGQYGVFYNAVPDGSAWTGSAWIYGLQQNAANRSNLALVNTGEADDGESVFSLDIYDGETGRLVKTFTAGSIPARGWHQINGILSDHAPGTGQGYVHVRRLSGNNPFLAYGVVNDGGAPGERSGDGAFLPSQ